MSFVFEAENDKITIDKTLASFVGGDDTYIKCSKSLSDLKNNYFEVLIKRKDSHAYIGIGISIKQVRGFPGWAKDSYALHGKKRFKEIFFFVFFLLKWCRKKKFLYQSSFPSFSYSCYLFPINLNNIVR